MNRWRMPWGLDGLLLCAGIAVPLIAVCLETRGETEVCCRLLPEVSFPESCYSRKYFQIDCPFCGLTRSIVHLCHGRWADSLRLHRLGWLAFFVLVAQIPYRLWKLSVPVGSMPDPQEKNEKHPDSAGSGSESWFWGVMAVLFLGNRILQMVW